MDSEGGEIYTMPKGSIEIPTPSDEELKQRMQYLSRIIRMSKVINMWPNTDNANPFLFYCKIFIVTLFCTLMTISFTVEIIVNFENLDSMAILVCFATVLVSGTFRYIYIHVKKDKYLFLISRMQETFIHFSLFPKTNRLSIMKYYEMGRRMTTAYSGFICIWILQMCLSPVFIYIWEVSRQSPDTNGTAVKYPVVMKTYAPFDYYTQPGNAFLFFTFQVVGSLLFAWIYAWVDIFWYMVILLSIGQFYLLKDSVETISEIVEQHESTELEPLKESEVQTVTEALKNCIRHHQTIREVVQLVEEISNPVILGDTAHALISVAFALFSAIISGTTGNWSMASHCFEYFVISVCHMFIYDYLGNELAVKEGEVADALRNISWRLYSNQKPLIVLMSMQANKPHKLTGGRMYFVNLEFFIGMMKATFSYFTFLMEMRDRNVHKLNN